MSLIELATQLRHVIEQAATSLPDETALQGIQLFPMWAPGLTVAADERYQYNGSLYRVVQGHTTQEGWEPDAYPAGWVKVSLDEWPEYVQPAGSHDAYNTGDKVTFNGEHYVCKIDGCTWSPEAYPAGWEKQE